MPQLLLHSGSFKGIQSPFWSCHLLCQSIPLSPVWEPKCPSLFYKVHKNREACSPYLYSKSKGGEGSGRVEAFRWETGRLEGIGIDVLNISKGSCLSIVKCDSWSQICIIYVLHYFSKKQQTEFALNCYQQSCFRVNLFPSDTGIMHVAKRNLWRSVMDGWQDQNEFLYSWVILTYFILIRPQGGRGVMRDTWWIRADWQNEGRAVPPLNMPSCCQLKLENYYCSQSCLERHGNGLPLAIAGNQQRDERAGCG